ncbi:MAG: hypothetical protein ACRDT9_14855, partial [Agromyces sp.]
WASYNIAIGAIIGSMLRDSPLLAIAVSIPIAVALGLLVDRAIVRLDRRRALREASLAREAPDEVAEGPVESEGVPDVR